MLQEVATWYSSPGVVKSLEMDPEVCMDMIHTLEQEIKDLYKELAQARDEFDKFKQKLILHTIEVKRKQLQMWYKGHLQ